MTDEELHRRFIYEPDSGLLCSLSGGVPYPWRYGGGTPGKGGQYLVTTVDGKDYYLHRLVWQYHYGVVPERLDHIDTHRENCLIDNLRECTRRENALNRRKTARNTSGFKGVVFHSKKGMRKPWQAKVGMGAGKVLSFGYYETAELAAAAYDRGISAVANEFARTNG